MNDKYEEKIRRLSIVEEKSLRKVDDSSNPDLQKFFERQTEENNNLKSAIKQLLQKDSSQAPILEEKEAEISKMGETLVKLQERNNKLEKKYKEAKVYYRLFKHSGLIQCKY